MNFSCVFWLSARAEGSEQRYSAATQQVSGSHWRADLENHGAYGCAIMSHILCDLCRHI